jgi:hypothetical protein
MKNILNRRSQRRGSLLIVAMILCAIIGVSLASYIQLGRTGLGISNRALYNNAAMNLAENGLEEAMYSINKKLKDPSYNWSEWTTEGGPNAWRKLPGGSDSYAFEQNATGSVRIYVYGYEGSSPKVVARSTVMLGGGASTPIEKWVEVQLGKTSKFANGLVARQQVIFKGEHSSVDSWESGSPAKPYSTEWRHAKGTVASLSVAVDAPLIENVQIWGYVATGGALPSVGSSGSIGPIGTAPGTINTAYVSTDFTANFDPVVVPSFASTNLGAITDSINLPRTGDAPASDGKFYYSASSITFDDKAVNIQKRLSGDAAPTVVLVLHNALDSIAIGGTTGALNIETGAKLTIYAAGDVNIGGRGIMNGGTSTADANPPANLQLWGTKPAEIQDIHIKGNGVMSGVIYAPQGSVRITGARDVCGSVVANDITLEGEVAFHYDESLGKIGGANPFRVSHWKELTTASARQPHAGVLDF